METNQEIYSDLPVPPGEYLEEVIVDLGMSKDELAKRMNRPAPKLSAIFKGDKAITPDTALQLEKVVGVPAHIWTGLEAEYRLALARQQNEKEQKRLKEEIHLVKCFRYADLTKLGIIAKKTRPTDKVLELHKFFGVTSLVSVLELRRYQAEFRTGKQKRSPEAVAAWLRIGELKAQQIHCTPFNKRRLKGSLEEVRSIGLHSPEDFTEKLQHLLSECGVALVLCPHLPGTYAHGATFWLGKDKAVVMMTLRYKWADVFWFSLFHELGHILLHERQVVILEGYNMETSNKALEEDADRFSADTLIPPAEYKAFLKTNRFFPEIIEQFAAQVGIPPGIVVGRLQKEGHIKPSWHNGLRRQLKWPSKE
ncbi:HigA family addiction module antitoxin [Thermodesulfobacteriota bacterium]